jgi:hypothetical protein
MSCCGKLIQSVETVARIAEGAMWELLDQHFRLPAEKCSLSGTRLAICRTCESGTYLNKNEYWTWVDANGGKQKFLSDIGDLTGWPPLPKRDFAGGGKLCCRICKCWIPKKAFVKSEQCPLGLWKGLDNG